MQHYLTKWWRLLIFWNYKKVVGASSKEMYDQARPFIRAGWNEIDHGRTNDMRHFLMLKRCSRVRGIEEPLWSLTKWGMNQRAKRLENRGYRVDPNSIRRIMIGYMASYRPRDHFKHG